MVNIRIRLSGDIMKKKKILWGIFFIIIIGVVGLGFKVWMSLNYQPVFLNHYVSTSKDSFNLYYFKKSMFKEEELESFKLDTNNTRISTGYKLDKCLNNGLTHISKICFSPLKEAVFTSDIGDIYLHKLEEHNEFKFYSSYTEELEDDKKGERKFKLYKDIFIESEDSISAQLLDEKYRIFINGRDIKEIELPMEIKKEDGLTISYTRVDEDITNFYDVDVKIGVVDRDGKRGEAIISILSKSPEDYNKEDRDKLVSALRLKSTK